MIQQRVRNRVMEYLELVSSFDEQRAHESDVPIATVPAEVFNQWEDWTRVFTRPERPNPRQMDLSESGT